MNRLLHLSLTCLLLAVVGICSSDAHLRLRITDKVATNEDDRAIAFDIADEGDTRSKIEDAHRFKEDTPEEANENTEVPDIHQLYNDGATGMIVDAMNTVFGVRYTNFHKCTEDKQCLSNCCKIFPGYEQKDEDSVCLPKDQCQ